MLTLYVWLLSWLKSEEAQDLIEYVVIVGLVIVVAVVGLGLLGGNVSTLWVKVSDWVAAISDQIVT